VGAAGGGHVRTASGETGLGGGNGAAAAAGTRRGVHSEDEDLHLVIDPAADTVRAAVASMRAQLEQVYSHYRMTPRWRMFALPWRC